MRPAERAVFSIAPASREPLWLLGGVVVLLLAIVLLFVYFAYLGRNTTFGVSAQGLSISGWPYGRTVVLDDLKLDEADVVSLDDARFRPRRRRNGVGLPGYNLGWFSLNGERALLFVTDPERVLYLPTRDGYSLLMSPRDPADLLEALTTASKSVTSSE